MHKIKEILITLLIVIGSMALVFSNFEDEKSIKGKIRIGVSDDTSGFVINYMKNRKYFEDVQINEIMESYSISDC